MRKDRKNLKKKRGLTPWNIRTHCKMVTKILWYLIQTKRGCRGLRQKRTCLRCGRSRFNPWVGKIPWRREWQPTPVFLPGESHGQRSLEGYSLCGHAWTTNTHAHIHTHAHTYTFLLPHSLCKFPVLKVSDKMSCLQKSPSPALHSQSSFSFALIALSQFLVLCVVAFDWLYRSFDSVLTLRLSTRHWPN